MNIPYYDRIDFSEGIDVNKTIELKECNNRTKRVQLLSLIVFFR